MSAVSFAFVPTVSFRPSSWISPSTEPSISRSSVPVMSPFPRRLDPSHPAARSAAASNGRTTSVLFLLVSKFVDSGAAACGVSGFFLSHIGPSLGQHTPRGFPGGVHQTRSPALAYINSLRDSGLPRILLPQGARIKAGERPAKGASPDPLGILDSGSCRNALPSFPDSGPAASLPPVPSAG